MQILFSRKERQTRRFKWLQRFRQNIDVPMAHALAEYLDILEKEDLREVLKRVHVPLQFINGREDEICTKETVAFLQKLSPNSRFDFFEHCGHFPFLSKPHEFNQIMEEFLKESIL
jgi:pimeloyl-ACP methyl ester carboxylesterase